MHIIDAPNVHCALPLGIHLLNRHGRYRSNRNSATLGDALVAPWPVTTIYRNPMQRVVFWPERDANPFLHLYEALWMLQGRNDVAPLVRYAKQMADFSDDGERLHGAYGHRWRKHFGYDQLATIAQALRNDPDTRRCILQMWDARFDGGAAGSLAGGKDYPCNTIASFQRGFDGELNLDVFCRSNDIIWGAYGANAVHFSFLLEYMAAWIGCPVGIYRQHSVNYHAYQKTFEPLSKLGQRGTEVFSVPQTTDDPYARGEVRVLPFASENIDADIASLLQDVDTDFANGLTRKHSPFFWVAQAILLAHQKYREHQGEDKYLESLVILAPRIWPQLHNVDWIVAARQWIERRYSAWKEKQS